MKITTIKHAVFLLLILFFIQPISSCNKASEDVPNCIKSELRKGSRNSLGALYRYDYKGNVIYEFHDRGISGSSYILDSDCNQLCSSLQDSENPKLCKEILDHATNRTVLWEK